MHEAFHDPQENEEENGPEAAQAEAENDKDAEKKVIETPPVPSTGVDTASAAEPEIDVEVNLTEEGDELVEVPPATSTGVDTASTVEPTDDYEVALGADVEAMGGATEEEE